jgi:hypothetical protein
MMLGTEREEVVESHLVKVIEDGLDGYCLKLKWLGGVGFPDRTILLPGGRIAFAELKRPKGGRKGPLQGWWREMLHKLGFKCEFLKTIAEVDAFVAFL